MVSFFFVSVELSLYLYLYIHVTYFQSFCKEVYRWIDFFFFFQVLPCSLCYILHALLMDFITALPI